MEWGDVGEGGTAWNLTPDPDRRLHRTPRLTRSPRPTRATVGVRVGKVQGFRQSLAEPDQEVEDGHGTSRVLRVVGNEGVSESPLSLRSETTLQEGLQTGIRRRPSWDSSGGRRSVSKSFLKDLSLTSNTRWGV